MKLPPASAAAAAVTTTSLCLYHGSRGFIRCHSFLRRISLFSSIGVFKREESGRGKEYRNKEPVFLGEPSRKRRGVSCSLNPSLHLFPTWIRYACPCTSSSRSRYSLASFFCLSSSVSSLSSAMRSMRSLPIHALPPLQDGQARTAAGATLSLARRFHKMSRITFLPSTPMEAHLGSPEEKQIDSKTENTGTSESLTSPSSQPSSHPSSTSDGAGLDTTGMCSTSPATPKMGLAQSTKRDPTLPGLSSTSSLFSPSFSSRQAVEDMAAGIETSPATGITIAGDLHGPWLVMLEEEQGKEQKGKEDWKTGPETRTDSSEDATSNSTTSMEAKQSSFLLNGELFVEKDGVVFYRPAQQLGHGIGKIELLSSPLTPPVIPFYLQEEISKEKSITSGKDTPAGAATEPCADAAGTAFLMELEVYQFSPTETEPPTRSTHWRISGVVNKVKSARLNYTTLSLLGIWECTGPTAELVKTEEKKQGDPEGESPEESLLAPSLPPSFSVGLLHAAKILPWESGMLGSSSNAGGEANSNAAWNPRTDVQTAFHQVFPTSLVLTSHLHRSQQMADEKKNTPPPPPSASPLPPPSTVSDLESTVTLDRSPPVLSLRSKSSPSKHLDLTPYRIAPEISELYYIPNYISEAEEEQIIHLVQNTPEPFKSKLTKRTCQEWGGTLCEVCQKSFVSDCNVPEWVQQTMDMQLYDGIFTPTTFPNSVRIHEYQEGDGIGPHTDGPIYVPLVTVLSAASTSVMHFYPPNAKPYEDPMEHYRDTFKYNEGEIGARPPVFSVILEPGSLLVFAGKEGYFSYPHGIPANELVVDLRGKRVMNRHLLSRVPSTIEEVHRKYRVSITTRHLLSRCHDQPRRVEYMMKRASFLYQQQPIPDPLFPPSTAWPSSSASSSSSSDGQETSSSSSVWKEKSVFDTATSSSSTGSASPVGDGSGSSVTVSRTLEEKLDRIRLEQQEIKKELQEVKQVLKVIASKSSNFENETSGILNHVTSTLLEIKSDTESVVDWVEDQGTPSKSK